MTENHRLRRVWLFVGLLAIVLLALACAKSEDKAAPAPAAPAPAAPKAAPAPTTPAAPSPAQPAQAPSAPAPTTSGTVTSAPTRTTTEEAIGTGLAALAKTHPEGQPLVPGGPPFYPRKLIQEKGFQLHAQYNQIKLPLWTKAVYGGQRVSTGTWDRTYLDYLKIQRLTRPSVAGMLLLIDMGLCSMIGREDHFDRCDGQYGRNQSVSIIPGVFQKWEQPDPITYIFTVRKGVLWPAVPPMARSDREVTADDIVWFLQVTKKEGVVRNNFDLVKEFVAVDRYTVRINMSAPHAEFLRHMANTSMGIFPKECYEEKDCLGSKLVSPSPFLLKESIIRQKAVLEKNPEFHLKGLPYNDKWTVLVITDAAATKAAFITRQVDHLSSSFFTEVESVKKQVPDMKIQSAWVIAGTTALRPQLKGPLADVRVRRAMAMTIDMPQLWEAVYEGHTAFANLVSRDTFGDEWFYTLDQAGEYYQFNPTRAKQLMVEAGYPAGFKLTYSQSIFTGGIPPIPLHLQQQWKKHLGIELNIIGIDSAQYLAALYDKKWDGLYYHGGWNINFWADQEAALMHFTKGQFLNLQGVDDPVVTELFQQVRGEMDPVKRTVLLWQFEQYELKQVYLFRMQNLTSWLLYQPWELNCVGHEVAWCTGINGPTWLSMIDPAKAPKR
jgi:ABC-type transport system substrate-binding protein